MPPEAAALATASGVAPEWVASHRSRSMQAEHLRSAHLVLAMAREHRRQVVEVSPARIRSTFTIREIGRLSAELTDADLRRAATADTSEEDSVSRRFLSMLAAVSARRGVSPQPVGSGDDDVVDPFGRSAATYGLAADQLAPGLVQVERLVRLAHS